MSTPLRIALLALAAAALLAPGGAPARTHATVLNGSVGPGFFIFLRDANGNAVRQLDPGEYELHIADNSEEHNFHLLGPGVDRSTDVAFIGQATWAITLVEGRYAYQCDPHATEMKGALVVGNPPPPPTPPPPPSPPSPPPASSASKLVATVGPGFTIGVRTQAGKAVKSVKAGAVTITVRDRSAIHNLHLSGPGVNKRTTVAFTGTRTWKLRLRKGVYRFVCDPHATAMKGSFRVS
jgi:plastocyanin